MNGWQSVYAEFHISFVKLSWAFTVHRHIVHSPEEFQNFRQERNFLVFFAVNEIDDQIIGCKRFLPKTSYDTKHMLDCGDRQCYSSMSSSSSSQLIPCLLVRLLHHLSLDHFTCISNDADEDLNLALKVLFLMFGQHVMMCTLWSRYDCHRHVNPVNTNQSPCQSTSFFSFFVWMLFLNLLNFDPANKKLNIKKYRNVCVSPTFEWAFVRKHWGEKENKSCEKENAIRGFCNHFHDCV